MAQLYGKDQSKNEICRRIGDIGQIAGAVNARLADGRGDGTHIVEVRTGTGLRYTVVPGRGMDICSADYCGYALSFVSKTGIVHPAFYETADAGFHRSFFAGLLTTCGLRNVGAACTDEGEFLGLHGRINNLPAGDVCVSNQWEGDSLSMRMRGVVRESTLYGENLTLTREITSYLGESTIRIHDEVENCGFSSEPLTILYHCNFGYPLLDASSRLVLPEGQAIPRDDTAAQSLDRHAEFQEPQDDFPETVFFHHSRADVEDNTYAGLFNPSLGEKGLGVMITYNKKNLPYLIQWKNMGNGDYVLALEPSNCYPIGRKEARTQNMLRMIEPGETKAFDLCFHVVTSGEELDALRFDKRV
jgi:hypothetical protein